MYVCMYVHTIVDGIACMCSICLYYPASLTLSLAVMSAPYRPQSGHYRLQYGGPWIPTTITERQRDKGREIGQIRDTQERNTDTQIEEDSRAGQGRSG